MTPKQLLSTFWNTQGFFTEVLAVFILVFFVLLFKMLITAFKVKGTKIILPLGFSLITFLMYVQLWASSKYLFNTPQTPLVNPIFVLLQSFLQGYKLGNGLNPSSFKPLYNGVPYLIGGQLLGFIFAISLFLVLFIPIKYYLAKINPKYQDIKKMTIFEVFHRDDKTLVGFSIKESIFLIIFTVSVGFAFYIKPTEFGTTKYDLLIVSTVIIFILLFFSSYFGYFAFLIYLDWFIAVLNFIENLKTKCNLQIVQSDFRLSFTSLFQMLITTVLTIIIPIIVGAIVIAIFANTKGDGVNF